MFSKWLFEEDRDFIYIRYNNINRKFYKHFICSHGMVDVYNSIDYIINFLELNGFCKIIIPSLNIICIDAITKNITYMYLFILINIHI